MLAEAADKVVFHHHQAVDGLLYARRPKRVAGQ